ncbi:Hypothetical protein DPCES_3679 [Desulfitobacterium hafniense]|uniref:Uncharacterized protein n=1 Tax=Desulfitobacterium hafniense TaxID=49338 RepID=A0A098B5A5_DESHA|nr:Hypothetical protein DPCES_3679 [Desulfitobacterium hafniense]
MGGENPELIEHAFIPAWEIYCQWQARALNHLIAENQYDLVFSHLHNVDCGGHQLWHCAKNQPEWAHTDENNIRASSKNSIGRRTAIWDSFSII